MERDYSNCINEIRFTDWNMYGPAGNEKQITQTKYELKKDQVQTMAFRFGEP